MPRFVVELDADKPSPKHSVTSRIVGEWLLKTLIHRCLSHRRTPCSRSRAKLSFELMVRHVPVDDKEVTMKNDGEMAHAKRGCVGVRLGNVKGSSTS
jgi:hypothetical protein